MRLKGFTKEFSHLVINPEITWQFIELVLYSVNKLALHSKFKPSNKPSLIVETG